MDYKQKYEQALEALRSLFAEQAIKHCDRVSIKDITNIFPELKESESIRLWLIDLLSTMQYHHCDEDMEMGNKALAWLEKQSEQNLANSAKTCKDEQKPVWSEEDSNMLEEIVKSLKRYQLQMPNYRVELQMRWLKSLKERYTWEPSDEQMKILNEVLNFAANHESPHWNDYIFGTLNNLIRQLKKLREE